MRQNYRFFLMWAIVALAVRLFFVLKLKVLTDDTYIYGELAKNWLQNGVYGLSTPLGPEPSFIRLPGYALFLALTWLVTGMEHYTAALVVQIIIDVATCFVIADLARRIATVNAAKVAFLLGVLCPFFANYSAVALTETWSIFFAALAMDAAVAAFDQPSRRSRWVLCGAALGASILLRPDGGILLAIIGGYGLVLWLRNRSRKLISGAVLLGVVALAPLIPWTVRNWRTFHVFQPLAPFNANMPWEFVPRGFQRWTRTWIADYSSVEDVWFKVDGFEVNIGDLPSRAFDNNAQWQRTDELVKMYVENGNAISPEIDEGFAELARERIDAHPFRYYVELPLLRIADLWLRPRTEMLPIDPHWWRLREDDPPQFGWSVLLAAINIFYIVAAMIAVARGQVRHAALFVAFAVIRTAFLAWMPNPEPRYVLECYPAVLALAGAAFRNFRDNTAIPGRKTREPLPSRNVMPPTLSR